MWALALVWGASYLFIKLGLEDLDPAFLVFVRLALGAAVLVPLAHRAGALAALGGRWRAVAVLAAVQVVVPFLLITYGEQHIASSLTGILVASAPIFTALLVLAGFGDEARIAPWNLGGIAVGLVGVGLLFGVDLTGSTDELLGGGMVVLAGLGYAVGALAVRRHFAGVPSLGVAAGSMALSALLTLPIGLTQLPAQAPSLGAAAAVGVLGVFGTGVAFLLFYTLIATVGAAKASVVAYLAPGFALFYGALFLDEPVTVGGAGGLALILAGCWLAAEGRPPWRPKPVPEPAAVTA
jgi:drug/metabolite transporter (DMT)-like permease